MACAKLAFLLLLIPIASAGFADMILTSPQDGQAVRQGGNITLALVIRNAGLSDGNAVYVTGVTLIPSSCINNGTPVTWRGAVIACPEGTSDATCAFRFRNATVNDTFAFENIPTMETCDNGGYSYSFYVEGNSEVGSGASFSRTPKNATTAFSVRFTGPFYCGDGICTAWKGENCSGCPRDCGRCPECTPEKIACVNDSVATCNSAGFWETTQFCEAGCQLDRRGDPACTAPCPESDRECVGLNTASVCVNKRWKNETCMFGCLLGECKGNCDTEGCNSSCSENVRYYNGTCDHVTGRCSYSKENCSLGCAGAGCAGPGGNVGGGISTVTIVAAIALIAAAALAIYFKFVKKKPAY